MRPSAHVAAFAAACSFCASFSFFATPRADAAPVDFGGHSYDLIGDGAISWTGARDAAVAAGGTLATITSASEQSFIESLLLDRDAPSGSYWFGLQETATEGVYAPISGTSSFSNFAAAEPNDGGPGETVGAIYWTADADANQATFARRGTWNDLPDAGYPDATSPNPFPDLIRAGYLVEFPTPVGGVGGPGGGGGNGDGGGDGNGNGGGDGNGNGGGDGNGGGSGGGSGGDGGSVIPIPPALLMFPATALLAYVAARRLRP